MNKTQYHLRADLQSTPTAGPLRAANVGPTPLTGQETRVVAELMRGMSNRQIARALSLSQYTVKFHLKNIFSKWGVRSRVELILRSASLAQQKPPPERYALSQPAAAAS